MKINTHKIKSLFLLSLLSSVSGKEERANNKSEISPMEVRFDNFPQLATNLTKRQNKPQKTLFFAGYPVSFSVRAIPGYFIKYCTASFAVVNTNNSECSPSGNDYGGFLTSSLCKPNVALAGTVWKEVYGSDGLLFLGNKTYDTFFNDDDSQQYYDTDYSFISNTGTWVNLELIPYTMGDQQLYPISGIAYVERGYRVCAYGIGSGYNCGNLVGLDLVVQVPNPWYPVNKDDKTINFLTFNGVGQVDLGVNGFYFAEDIGGPVYTESYVNGQTFAWALGNIIYFDNSDPNHKVVYYTPLDRVLGRIFDNDNCSYTLLTYNENNAQEYDKLLAQVEIPPKK